MIALNCPGPATVSKPKSFAPSDTAKLRIQLAAQPSTGADLVLVATLVRVMLHSQLTVGLLDIVRRSVLGDTELLLAQNTPQSQCDWPNRSAARFLAPLAPDPRGASNQQEKGNILRSDELG